MKEFFYGAGAVFMVSAIGSLIFIAGYLGRIAATLEKIASCFGG